MCRSYVLTAIACVLVGLFAVPSALGALCLDGNSGAVVMTSALPVYQSFTIELRFLWDGPPPPPTDPDNQACLFYDGSGGEVQLVYYDDGGQSMLNLGVLVQGGPWHGAPSVVLGPYCDGQLHHLAGVYDWAAHEIRVYIDGILQSAGPIPALPLHIPGLGTAVGRYGAISRKYASGQFEEVRFWTVARTQAELIDHMWGELDGSQAGLVGYWRLDESEGSTAHDLSSQGNDGALVGAATWCQLPTPAVSTTWGNVKWRHR